MYSTEQTPELGVGDVARKLDGRIVKLSAVNNSTQKGNSLKKSAIFIDISSK
jgi:hypothetical protein